MAIPNKFSKHQEKKFRKFCTTMEPSIVDPLNKG